MNVWEGVDPFAEAQNFCDMWGIEGPVLVDVDGAFARQLGVRGVPTNILVDEDGTITCVGASTPPELEAAVQQLLGPGVRLERAEGSGEWRWDKEESHIEAELSKRVVGPGTGDER